MSVEVVWIPPDVGWIKFNIDGCVV